MTRFGTAGRALRWFVDGLAEASLWAWDRARPAAGLRIELGKDSAALRTADGGEIASLGDGANAERIPPALRGRLKRAAIDVVVPPSWFARRTLDPVAAQSVPFLDAFARHQIERLTPWRAADTLYRVRHGAIAGDATRIAVEIGVVPKRLVGGWIATLDALGPRRLRVLPGTPDGDAVAITIERGGLGRLGRSRRVVSIGLAVLTAGFVVLLGTLTWQTSLVRDDVEAQDRVMEDRKALLARAQHRTQAGRAAAAALRALRDTRPLAAETVEALSAALPDTAYLTDFQLDGDHLSLTGVTTDLQSLVPALERSGHFADVAFGAATTKLEAGAGDRFHLELRVPPPSAPKPRPAGADASAGSP